MKKLVLFVILVAMLVCSIGVIGVSAEESTSSAKISIEQKEIAADGILTISFSGIGASAANNTRVEMYYAGETLDGWWDPTSVCTLKDSTGTVLRGESGTIAFPTDDKKGATGYQPGVYQVVLFDGSRNLLDRILVTIGDAPKISVDKELYERGELIELTYENITPALGKNLEARVYSISDTVGLIEAYTTIYLTDAEGALLEGESGTVEFPDVWLEEGEYKVLLADGDGLNNILCEPIYFNVTAEILSTEEPETDAPSATKAPSVSKAPIEDDSNNEIKENPDDKDGASSVVVVLCIAGGIVVIAAIVVVVIMLKKKK